MTVSSERVSIELTPARVEMEPGGSPVEVVVTIQNLSDVVEQYAVELSGLDADWYTAPVTRVGRASRPARTSSASAPGRAAAPRPAARSRTGCWTCAASRSSAPT